MSTFLWKGNFIYCQDKDSLHLMEQGYLVCEDGISKGVFETLPEKYSSVPLTDWGECIILPGLTDLHIHAPQYAMRSNGMDMELLDWLETYTFPTESRYQELAYAEQAYGRFARDVKKSATTRACMFGTLHVEATELLMELLEQTGIKAFVGKVNMDRNCPDYLREESADRSLADTKRWLEEIRGRFSNITPILTPRFVPTCTDELMEGLGELQQELGLTAQSHLSENESEIAWVQELCPDSQFYGDAYDRQGLFGTGGRTIMAHCVHSTPEEVQRMKERGVFIAHCPQSNTNLSSGIAPAKEYLRQGMNIGLGTDIAGGYSLSIFRAMADAVQASKLLSKLKGIESEALTVEEAFYLGTKGGGAFFGKVGSFDEGYELDAVIVDDTELLPPHRLGLRERLERIIYLSDERNLAAKFVSGQKVWER